MEIKSLIDIRSHDIREMVSHSKAIKIDIQENEILVHLIEKSTEAEIIRLDQRNNIDTIAISRRLLRTAGGEDVIWQGFSGGSNSEHTRREPDEKEKQDISDVIRVISTPGY